MSAPVEKATVRHPEIQAEAAESEPAAFPQLESPPTEAPTASATRDLSSKESVAEAPVAPPEVQAELIGRETVLAESAPREQPAAEHPLSRIQAPAGVSETERGPRRVRAKSMLPTGSDLGRSDIHPPLGPRFSPMPLPAGSRRSAVDRQPDLTRVAAQPVSEPKEGAPFFESSPDESSLFPLHLPAAPVAAVVVQREEAARSPRASLSQARSTDEQPAGTETETESQAEVNKDQLAREVYEMLKQRMIVEREQFWGF